MSVLRGSSAHVETVVVTLTRTPLVRAVTQAGSLGTPVGREPVRARGEQRGEHRCAEESGQGDPALKAPRGDRYLPERRFAYRSRGSASGGPDELGGSCVLLLGSRSVDRGDGLST